MNFFWLNHKVRNCIYKILKEGEQKKEPSKIQCKVMSKEIRRPFNQFINRANNRNF